MIGLAERLLLARLLIALADRDHALSAELMRATGFATLANDPWVLDKWACWRYSRFTPDVVAELGGAVNFETRIGQIDPIATEAQEYVMAYRMSALLRGNALGLGDLQIDAAKRWRRHAVALLRSQREPLPQTVPGRPAQCTLTLPATG